LLKVRDVPRGKRGRAVLTYNKPLPECEMVIPSIASRMKHVRDTAGQGIDIAGFTKATANSYITSSMWLPGSTG
jgi:hypothetical protein